MNPSRSRFVRFSVASLLIVAPGCAAVRAQVGVGFGLGADVQVLGMQHVGALLGTFHEFGPNYGRGNYSKTEYTVLGPYHHTIMTFDEESDRDPIDHLCIGFFPGAQGLVSDDPIPEPWALEFGVAMAFLELRLGVNPIAPLFEDEPEPIGPLPGSTSEPTPTPTPTPAPAPSGPTASAQQEPAPDAPRTYGGEVRQAEPAATPAPETPAKPAPPPPPPPPPAAKEAPPTPPATETPPGDDRSTTPAEEAVEEVLEPATDDDADDASDASDDEASDEEDGGDEAPPAPAPSDER